MQLTGPCINKISINCLKKFSSRLNNVLGSSFLEDMLVEFFLEGVKEKNIVDELNVEEQNNVLEMLEGIEGKTARNVSANLREYLKI